MNKRDYKESAPQNIWHVYNRGNNKEKIFFDKQDYKAFLFRLGLCLGFDQDELNKEKMISMPYSRIRITDSSKNDFKLHAFCLMPNHFHLLIEQIENISISNMMLKLQTSYARYLNKKYKRVGHVFQDQFKSVLIVGNSQLMWNISYIHMNPVKAKIVKHPSRYIWSSYNDFALDRNLLFINKEVAIQIFGDKEDFIRETVNLEDENTQRYPLT